MAKTIMTINTFLKFYQQKVDIKKKDELSFLLFELSCYSNSEFFNQYNKEIDEKLKKDFINAFELYTINNIPIQHILGYSYFYGRKFVVSGDVLIPRKETEELVENVLIYFDKYFNFEGVKVLDLGTGSGCIPITLKLEEPSLIVDATDISENALKVAVQNSKLLNADVNYFISDWFSEVTDTYDIIIANPPYIPINEEIEEIVKKEPDLALYGGNDGLLHYETILKNIAPYTRSSSLIAFEHGFEHKEGLTKIINKYLPHAKIINIKDISGKDRMTFVGLGGVLDNE
ncbi:MAG: peptide chain release factor N(5)-glutamine methyltransferase [Acholeplasmatales bacterium]|nr:peptide chain release factor N(5)-glutamine methyltransferase [Acholeplasmatales bacterium]